MASFVLTAKRPSKKHAPAVGIVADALLPEIRGLIEAARHKAIAAANLSMVTLYWNIGRVISMEVQEIADRAAYGSQVIAHLAEVLLQEHGKGFSAPNLWDVRRFFGAFQILQTPSRELPESRSPNTSPCCQTSECSKIGCAFIASSSRTSREERRRFRVFSCGLNLYRLTTSPPARDTGRCR